MEEDTRRTHDEPPSIATQTRFWNDWNRKYRDRSEQHGDAAMRGQLALELLESLGLDRPRILEIGCSTGWLCQELCRFGDVTGTDLADEVVEIARTNVPEARFLSGDVLDLDLGAGFDVVVSLETIAHVEDKSAFCRRVADALVPGGHLILTTQNAFIWERTSTLRQPREILQSFLTMDQLRDLLLVDFDILDTRTIIPGGDMGFLRWVNSRWLNAPFHAIAGRHRVRRLKERFSLGNTLVVLARKR